MNFDFEKFKSGLYKTAVAAKETSLSVVAVTKCKIKIIEFKSELEDCFVKIGKIIYSKDDSTEANKKIESLCNEIDCLKENIKKVQNIIDDNLNRKECPECKTKSEKNFGFCPKCGYKFVN